jgi:hypothetical protein
MSAEVYEEPAYVVDCALCGYQSEYFESRSEAERDAERHDERCDGAVDGDPRTDREKYQDELDAIAGEARL